jgi:cyclopropane fatty-acyl-phospholipid synthase-like methyltransferase
MSAFENPKARWSQRFATEDYIFGLQANAYLRAQIGHLTPGRTLAIADGEGRNGVWLAEQGHRVESFDFIEAAVIKAQKLAAERGVSLQAVCCDWESFDWRPACYDNIVGIFFQFLGPQERVRMFEKIHQTLKPGGTLLLQGYSTAQLKYNTGGPGKLDHLYDEALLLQSFPGYTVLDLQTYEAEIHEGQAHAGMSGLVGYVGRRPV